MNAARLIYPRYRNPSKVRQPHQPVLPVPVRSTSTSTPLNALTPPRPASIILLINNRFDPPVIYKLWCYSHSSPTTHSPFFIFYTFYPLP